MDVELLAENAHWLWLSLGGLLLAAEMLGASGYLLWSGVSAVIIGLLTWGLPLPWAWQGTLFALLTISIAILWWYWLRNCARRTIETTVLNQRSQQLIGVRTTLTEAVVDGIGRARIGDSTWRVKADDALPAGTAVEVIAIEGITLHVRALKV
ncbi:MULTISPECIES: NfeD family protein [unclassified Symbiopectobacterium]|uniref:NfeD family protein n=1 Tax=unclassified Symbiopectobacterium TaxID=2794573 RepID=UPI0022275985|nr:MULTISPECIES: NfeD family protein [unclassified Symbiopectobacterium]MCW2474719.1 NfeD family protein [Candidatus Symbiopectobacterium sp. NZEC151]MCW2482562.1 NfeD family protein [Candidatus Symbiopectobacterium sp. NZEC135]MCW2487553.1 NfeD family protein [Candidatus Symbiopectobacterium sp. NZEC127]